MAPVWRASACASFWLIDVSGKTALTRSRWISALSFAMSPALGCAWVVCDGMTAPMTCTP